MKKLLILILLTPSIAFSQVRQNGLYGNGGTPSWDNIVGKKNLNIAPVKRSGFDSLAFVPNDSTLKIKAIQVIVPTGATVTPSSTDTTLTLTISGVATLTGTETLTNKTVNGVTLQTGGLTSEFLNRNGVYSTPSGGGGSPVAVYKVASDIVGTATTSYQDATGLSFSVTAGQAYSFTCIMTVTSTATTEGWSMSLTGPASPTYLSYTALPTQTSTGVVIGNLTSYDATPSTISTAFTTGSTGVMHGMIIPSSSGTVTMRFRSENATAGAITVKAGSSVLVY